MDNMHVQLATSVPKPANKKKATKRVAIVYIVKLSNKVMGAQNCLWGLWPLFKEETKAWQYSHEGTYLYRYNTFPPMFGME